MTANACWIVLWFKWGSTKWALQMILMWCNFHCFTHSPQTSPLAIRVQRFPLCITSHLPPHLDILILSFTPSSFTFFCFWLILSHLRFWNYQWELFKSLRYEMATRRLWKTLINPKWKGAHCKSQGILALIEIWLVLVVVLNPVWG